MKAITYKTALAPLAGVTDYAFRAVCRRFGAEYTYTEMLSAKAMHFGDLKTAELGAVYDDDLPMSVQIFGSDPDTMAEAAEKIAAASYRGCRFRNTPTAIDINMGCPAPKVSNNGDGSSLLKTPELAEKIVAACVKASSLPVTVKMRIGWDENSICGVEFAKRMEAAGASAITVHGRTRAGRFSAPVNFDEIRRIKEAVTVPVIGNGDIFTADDAVRMFARTGCDAVMVGRGSLGNPWLFGEIAAKLNGEKFTPPTITERVNTALWGLSLCIEKKGERMAVIESRKLLAWYLKGVRGASEARGAINSASTYDEMADILLPLAERLSADGGMTEADAETETKTEADAETEI